MEPIKTTSITQSKAQSPSTFCYVKKFEADITNPIDFSFTGKKKTQWGIQPFHFQPILPSKSKESELKATKWSKYEAPVIKATGLSQDCIEEIISNEGVKLKAYKCSAGRKTIGIGHNIDADKNYKHGNKINTKTAFSILQQDLLNAKKNIENLTEGKQLTQGQKEALTDIVFNVGPDQLKKSKLISLIKKGQIGEAIKEFNYVKAGDEVIPGLCKRQMKNIVKFTKGTHSKQAIKSIEKLKKAALAVFNKKIKQCKNNAAKKKYQNQKLALLQDCDTFKAEASGIKD